MGLCELQRKDSFAIDEAVGIRLTLWCKMELYAAFLTVTKLQRAPSYQNTDNAAHFLFFVIEGKLNKLMRPAIYHIGQQDIDSIRELS